MCEIVVNLGFGDGENTHSSARISYIVHLSWNVSAGFTYGACLSSVSLKMRLYSFASFKANVIN